MADVENAARLRPATSRLIDLVFATGEWPPAHFRSNRSETASDEAWVASIDYFERKGTPFVVAVNCFDEAPRFEPDDIRIALSLRPWVPVVTCDARQRESVKKVLVCLVKYVMTVSGKAGGIRIA